MVGKRVSIRQSQVLIRKSFHDAARLREFNGIEAANGRSGQRIDESQSLNRAILIVPAEEPSMSLCDNKR